MFQIEYNKPLRLVAAAAMALKLLFQLFCVIFLQETLPLWAILIMVMEAFSIFALWRGERDFITVLPYLGIAILENVLFFSSDGAMLATTTFHLMTTIVIAILFVLSMVGRMYEHRGKLLFILAILVAAWAYDLFLSVSDIRETGPFTPADVRILILDPIAFGLAAAWASLPKMVHDLSDEEIEEKLEKNKQMVATGRMSIAEYNEEAMMLIKGRKKKK